MLTNQSTDYRYERKFLINSISLPEIEMILKMHSFGFKEIYQERYINNIYFDTPLLSNYFDNIDGNYNKKKTRVRWYGDLIGEIKKASLEYKIKKGELGQKKIYPIDSFNFKAGCDSNKILELLEGVKNANEIKTKGLRPTLINRYKRKYFQSHDKEFRVTLDTDLNYYSVSHKKISLLQSYNDTQNVILELKYGQNKQVSANQISNFFPFRMTKSSKYVVGIERVLTRKQL